jgi:aryl-alcohol dehydrogenase-like predicted oxidoreductase
MLDGWEDLRKKYKCTTGQLVIAWTLAQPGITSALCGARKAEHALDNARAGDVGLDPADAARIRRDAESLGAPLG